MPTCLYIYLLFLLALIWSDNHNNYQFDDKNTYKTDEKIAEMKRSKIDSS